MVTCLSKDLNIINGKGQLYDAVDWHQIYSRSNEKVKQIFESVDIRDKKVLSVLASSDYLFSCLVNNVKSVETFDINSLTLRYYYLRKWLIEKNYIDGEWLDYQTIKEIVMEKMEHVDQSESESAYFWYYFLEKGRFINLYSQPIFDYPIRPTTVYDDKLELLKERIKNYNIKYYNIDITYDSIDSKYDTIFISNILDYCNTKSDLIRVKNNLYGLLNDNGEVIANQMICHKIALDNQIEVFGDRFDYEELFTDVYGDFSYTYYKYSKR